ncbi:hypothetical protein ACFYVK_40335 [Streptomyces chartreusis]|uniref:SLAC1 family transporter n=1 Tax=Streptomyces chartreusis TaxID=1969 RepID=UPI0036B4B19C
MRPSCAPHAPAGQPRLTLLLGCYAMLALGLVATLLVLAMIYGRLVHHEVPNGTTVPTVRIGLATGLTVAVHGTCLAWLVVAGRHLRPATWHVRRPQVRSWTELRGGPRRS